MVRLPLSVSFFIICLCRAVAQDTTRIVETDSSTIKTMIFGFTDNRTKKVTYTAKLVDEYLKGKNLVRETDYYEDTLNIRSIGYTDYGLHNRLGISKIYSKRGKLELVLDYDKRTWQPLDTFKYRNYRILSIMKLKGDSIVKSIYGKHFFDKYIRWNMFSSSYFDRNYSEPSFAIEWIRDDTNHRYGATEFNMVYDIYYDNRIYEEAVGVIFNESGQLLSSHGWNENWTIHNHGLERFSDTLSHLFKLTHQGAIRMAIQFGLKKKDAIKAYSNILWKGIEDSTSAIFNGHFIMCVFQNAGVKNKKGKGKYVIHRQYYNVWLFDPWTCELVKKTKMYREINGEPGMLMIGGLKED